MLSYNWVKCLRVTKKQLEDMVIQYQNTKDKRLLDDIAKGTIKIIYKVGKSYKVPIDEMNYLFGIALIKGVNKWNKDGLASFSTYLTTIIINELKMYLRNKQCQFEGTMLQELEDHCLSQIIESQDEYSILIYEHIVNDIIKGFENENTQKALQMYCEGHLVENIVKELRIGRTNFYYDLKRFKMKLREELGNDKTNI